MSSNDADTFGTPRTPEVEEDSSGSRTQRQKIFDFSTIAVLLSAIHLLIGPYLSKVPYLSLGFMHSRYWHLAFLCVDSAIVLALVTRAPVLYILRRREVKEPRDPTIRSKEELVSALLLDQKLKLLIRSIFTDRYVEYDYVLPIVERNLRDFASNLAAEGWDDVAVDATDPLITDEGSHYAATQLVNQALSFSLHKQPNETSTVASEQDSSLFITSPAYRIFKADCLRLAHEPHEKRISQWIGSAAYGETGARLEPEALEQAALEISWTPLDLVKRSQDNANTLANQIKATVEGYFGPTWNWWPLTPRQYPLPAGYTRVEWLSPCGTAHYLDLPEDRVLALLNPLNPVPWFMLPKTGSTALMVKIRPIMRKAFFAVFGDINDLSSHSRPRRGRRSSSRHKAGASSHPPSGSTRYQPPTDDTERSGKDEEHRSQSRKVRNTPPAGVPKNSRHVYLCTNRGQSYRPSSIKCEPNHKDRAFFKDLKTKYIASRGFWRYHLSMWIYDHCEFYQIVKYGINACSPIKVGFPSESEPEYKFRPAPPRPEPPHGPITEVEFRERFYRSGEKYYRWQAKWEAIFFENDDQAYQALPKRTEAINLEEPGKEMFYGLYAKEKRSFARFLAYFFLCFFCPGLIFFIVYLAKRGKASELPSAGWPLTVALTLVGILMGELVHSREAGKKP